MINAHIEMNLNDHMVVIATYILEILKSKQGESVTETLMREFLSKNDSYTPDQFFDSLTLLYSLGFIDMQEYKVVANYV
ncbi:hypothetical protein [Endozoicomonas elysicola]|uniref:Uncharacterized protein n=1 Tax=Endozoicomonas elysicola TaxID=305900 RepID=A0A081KB89_9GAMM|nr:hypothetical protein [Endozoicomonas elysicola]KEI71415.1 hypothetical protein GV64_12280 [Endozoicomonas elysicola]